VRELYDLATEMQIVERNLRQFDEVGAMTENELATEFAHVNELLSHSSFTYIVTWLEQLAQEGVQSANCLLGLIFPEVKNWVKAEPYCVAAVHFCGPEMKEFWKPFIDLSILGQFFEEHIGAPAASIKN